MSVIKLVVKSPTFKLNWRAFNSFGSPQQAGEFGFFHGLGDSDSAASLSLSDIVNANSRVHTGIRHLAFFN